MQVHPAEGPYQVQSGSFPPTRAEALSRLKEFLPSAGHYSTSRNSVLPGHPNVSRLSAAIRSRLITEEEVLDQVLAQHPFPVVEKFVQEVVWRSYWKGWLELRPQVWATYRNRLQSLRREAPEPIRRRAEEVAAGRSGVAVMDRFARELLTTGYLHNHARMWWASFWIHVERLPWELGADFFLRHLLDADPASNTLSWRWVAGLQTSGKVYLVRRSNLERFADPSWLDDTTGLHRLDDSRVQPAVVDDHADTRARALPELPDALDSWTDRTGLWIHPEEGFLEKSPVRDLANPVLIEASVEPAPDATSSPVVCAWQALARADISERAAQHFGSPVSRLSPATGGIADVLLQESLRVGCRRLVTVAPAVGPLAEELPRIRQSLEAQGVDLVLVRRRWDSVHWPLAAKGFFPFWERVRKTFP